MDLLIAQLDETGIDYELIDCDPDLADTAQFCEAYGFAMEQSANTILVVGKSDPAVFAACLVLAHTRLDVNKVVRKRFGVKKASFASGDDTVRLTGMQIGGVTPFGLPHDLPIWIDSRVLDCPQILLGGGSRSRKVLVAPRVLIEIGAEVVEDLAKLPPPPT
ncbi:MAG: prolyl-tRNA editing enzyme YbaK/EbsC (Cys-tRNA(Pro) deacylase) [Ilumatobacter sp.]|jgi:prolyl-tRNA editing enzyme YbaK/EbsC (Cys-tRNA(Pro) deacylase)